MKSLGFSIFAERGSLRHIVLDVKYLWAALSAAGISLSQELALRLPRGATRLSVLVADER